MTVALTVALAPQLARAGHGEHPPTPVVWPNPGPCAVVDRSVEPTVHLDYAVPFDDVETSADELDDSRTHQFLASCRPLAGDLLPSWLSADDVARAELAGLIEPGSVGLEQILDMNPAWADCTVRISADDDRRPITAAAAAAGVDWDLAGLPVGVWQVQGYTFEPPTNLWTTRSGYVKVLDDPEDPAQDLPAVAWRGSSGGGWWWSDRVNQVELCVDLFGPGQLIAEWAPAPEQAEDPLVWEVFDTLPVEQDGLQAFVLDGPKLPGNPSANVQIEGYLRLRIVDMLAREQILEVMGRTYERCLGHCGDDSGSGGGSGGPDDTGDTGSGDDPGAAGDRGCGCSSARDEPGPRAGLGVLLLVLMGLGLRARDLRPAR